ncbi:MAG TPA: iron-sulfur cluster assembly scaffold protein [Gammaproteobacteria bacterium]|nr:iron-sulfur cluster assembly scaffold protein [Gammaproteobacteria bacterium]
MTGHAPLSDDAPVYGARVMERFLRPPNAGRLPGGPATFEGEGGRYPDGCVIRIGLAIGRQGRVADARFLAFGCPYAIACASCVAERAIGRGAVELVEFTAPDLIQWLELPAVKRPVLIAAEDAVRAAARTWLESLGGRIGTGG